MDHHAEREDRKSLGMFREAGGGGVEEDEGGSETEAMAGCRWERMRRRGGGAEAVCWAERVAGERRKGGGVIYGGESQPMTGGER